MKKAKGLKQAHTSNQKFGMGDFYGVGVKNKVGRVNDSYMNPKSKNIGKPPKSLA